MIFLINVRFHLIISLVDGRLAISDGFFLSLIFKNGKFNKNRRKSEKNSEKQKLKEKLKNFKLFPKSFQLSYHPPLASIQTITNGPSPFATQKVSIKIPIKNYQATNFNICEFSE